MLGLRGQEAKEGQEKQIGTIEAAQTQKDNAQAVVDALKSDPATEQKTIDALAIAAKITLVTPVEQILAEKEPFKSTDKASITALQDVLYERKLMTSTTHGNFGTQTQSALRIALGLPANHDFKGEITQEMLDQLKPTEAMIEARANDGLTKASDQVATLEDRANAIDKSLAAIEVKRPSVIDQQIATETDNIKKLQADITNYDQDKLDPLRNIQGKLTEHTQNSANNMGEDSANNVSTTPYQAVEKELTANNISVLSSEQNTFFNSTNLLSQGGKSNTIDDIKAVQTFLIEKEYLSPTWKDKAGNIHPSDDGNFGGGTTKAVKAYQLAHNLKQNGVVDIDFRAAMKMDVLNQLTTEEINQKVQVELDARTENKETAIAGMGHEIKDTQTHIDQLQIEQTTLLTNQLAIQQEKLQELTSKIEQNQEAVKNIDTLKTTTPLDATLADPSHEAALKAQGIELEKRPPESSIHALLTERKTVLEADIKSGQMQLAALKHTIESTKIQLAEREITPIEKVITESSQDIKEPIAVKSDSEVTQSTPPLEEKEKTTVVDNPNLENKASVIEVKEETKETVEAKPWSSGDKQFDDLYAAAISDNPDALRAVCKEIRHSEFGQKFQAETNQLHQLEQQQLELAQQQKEQEQLTKQTQGPSRGIC